MTACDACGYIQDPPARTWTYRIRHALLSLNEIKSNYLGRAGSKYKGERRFYVAALARQRTIPKATGFRQILVHRLYGKRRRRFDYDNMVGGSKPLVDALREKGVILNDNNERANIAYFQAPSPDGKDYVEIVAQEFE